MADTVVYPTGVAADYITPTPQNTGFTSAAFAGDGNVYAIVQITSGGGAVDVSSEGMAGPGSARTVPVNGSFTFIDRYTAVGTYYIYNLPTLFRFKVNTGTNIVVTVSLRSIYIPTNAPVAAFLSKPTVSFTATNTAVRNVFLVDATAAPVVATLPDAVANKDHSMTFKKLDASANAVTLTPINAQLIDNAATNAITVRYNTVTVVSDGTNWFIVT